MDRTNFYKTVTVVDGQTGELIPQYDFLHNSLSNFVMNYNPQYYTVNEADIYRPDMISFKVYNTVVYWWLICYVNEIHDPYSDIYVGQLLIIPNILDIYDFFKKYRAIK
jgi:hypothetical protein